MAYEDCFIKIGIEQGEVCGVIASCDDSYEMMEDQIYMTIDFNDNYVEKLLDLLQKNYKKSGLLVKVEVNEESRGKGFGADLVDTYTDSIGKFTEVDILFARIKNKQKDGFKLQEFYEKRGYEPVKFSENNLLMINKGQAKIIIEQMSPKNNIISNECSL
jgi:GNAT superfamily N-acetyltransferase